MQWLKMVKKWLNNWVYAIWSFDKVNKNDIKILPW